MIEKLHKVNITINSLPCTNIGDRYIYTDLIAMIWLQIRVKRADCCKTQVSSHICS